MRTEKQKMMAGEYYLPTDPELTTDRLLCRQILAKINATSAEPPEIREELIFQLLQAKPKNAYIEPPFCCDYGYNINIGDNVFINYNCAFLDVCTIKIGHNVMFGPGVQLYTATHPLDWPTRNSLIEFGKPITIGDNCWLGGSVVVCPGVTIGEGCVIGAGSVVIKDLPANSLAVGNPCVVKKTIDQFPEKIKND